MGMILKAIGFFFAVVFAVPTLAREATDLGRFCAYALESLTRAHIDLSYVKKDLGPEGQGFTSVPIDKVVFVGWDALIKKAFTDDAHTRGWLKVHGDDNARILEFDFGYLREAKPKRITGSPFYDLGYKLADILNANSNLPDEWMWATYNGEILLKDSKVESPAGWHRDRGSFIRAVVYVDIPTTLLVGLDGHVQSSTPYGITLIAGEALEGSFKTKAPKHADPPLKPGMRRATIIYNIAVHKKDYVDPFDQILMEIRQKRKK